MSIASSTVPTFTSELHQLTFGWIDYLLFTGLLGVSLLIGLYFGFFSKQDTAKEYLFGGKTMSYFPVAVSILASLLSGITFLGIPTEIYFHGTQYIMSLIPAIIGCIISADIFLPIFYDLQVSSSYDYLELRFSKKLRSLATTLYILSMVLYIPIVVYVPALAFSQVTGYSVHSITPIFSIVCITYTTVGGVKAVVWTDTIQFFFTIGGLVTILIIGVHSVGGFSEVWRIADEGQRLELFNMDPNPFERNTFWEVTFGTFFILASRFCVGQKFVQRFLAIETISDIKKAIYVQMAGYILLQLGCILTGLIVYAKYHDCDPLSVKLIKRSDQTLPYYVMDVAGHIPGLPGIFLVGLVSSALSTMSASLNTLSGIVYEAFVDEWIAESENKEAKAANIMKIICVVTGLITIALVFLIEHLGTIFEIYSSLSGVVDGPLFGFFLLGMFVPWVGSKGAMTGAYVSLILMTWLCAGSQWHVFNKRIRSTTLPVSIENCSYPLNETLREMAPTVAPEDEPLMIFKLNFLYVIGAGTVITTLVALATSLAIGETDLTSVDHRHFAQFVRRWLPKKKYEEVALTDVGQEKITT